MLSLPHTHQSPPQLNPKILTTLTSAAARASKPDPSIFHQALRTLQSTPPEAAHVGDGPRADLEGAAAGIPAFLVDRPTHGLPEFLDFCRSQSN